MKLNPKVSIPTLSTETKDKIDSASNGTYVKTEENKIYVRSNVLGAQLWIKKGTEKGTVTGMSPVENTAAGAAVASSLNKGIWEVSHGDTEESQRPRAAPPEQTVLRFWALKVK